jgi:hypothetical protein
MNIKESKITYIAIGVIAGLAIAYAWNKWKSK